MKNIPSPIRPIMGTWNRTIFTWNLTDPTPLTSQLKPWNRVNPWNRHDPPRALRSGSISTSGSAAALPFLAFFPMTPLEEGVLRGKLSPKCHNPKKWNPPFFYQEIITVLRGFIRTYFRGNKIKQRSFETVSCHLLRNYEVAMHNLWHYTTYSFGC